MLKQRFIVYEQLNPHELSKEEMDKIKQEMKCSSLNTMSDQYADFVLWASNLPSRQENFAEFLSKKLKKSNVNILEVGAGRRARLARNLKQRGFNNITCIDPKIEDMQAYGIETIIGKFDYRKIDLTPYDIVIAQEPCDATEHVVRACINQDKPFMMTLCGVPHKMINGDMPKKAEDWYWSLVDISKEKIKLRYLNLDPITSTPILRTNYI